MGSTTLKIVHAVLSAFLIFLATVVGAHFRSAAGNPPEGVPVVVWGLVCAALVRLSGFITAKIGSSSNGEPFTPQSVDRSTTPGA